MFAKLILHVWLLLACSALEEKDLVVEPEALEQPIKVGYNASIVVSYNRTIVETIQLKVNVEPNRIARARIDDNFFNLTADSPSENVTIFGEFLGYTGLQFYYCPGEQLCRDEDWVRLNTTYEVKVIRVHRFVDTLFTILILCLVVVANLAMGCKVDMGVVKEVLRRPTAPIIGFFCQFTIMPPLSFLLAWLFQLNVAESLGMFAVGCSPGGGASNMWTLLLNGDISLSITMTLISTFASLGMFPLWLFTLGRVITDEATFTIPFQNIIGSLVGTLVPVAIGILLQYKKPNVAKQIAKITKPMLFVFLIFILTFGVYVNLFVYRLFHLKLIGASMLLPWLGYLSGLFVAWICKQPLNRIIAISLETGIQNVGVAIFTLRLSLPQPDNDLSIIGSICPACFTSLPLFVTFLIMLIRRKCMQKKSQSEGVKSEERNGNHEEGMSMTAAKG